jgi:hypothetical protein
MSQHEQPEVSLWVGRIGMKFSAALRFTKNSARPAIRTRSPPIRSNFQRNRTTKILVELHENGGEIFPIV